MNRILVVDDEPSILHGLALGLSSTDNVVDCVSTGEAALKKGREVKYDVLIVDLCLPDIHGLDVVRTLRERNPQLIAIVITAQNSRESAVEAMGMEVDGYFEKPFLIDSIREAIGRE